MWFRLYLFLFVLHYLTVNASDCEEEHRCGINEVWDCSCLPRPTCDDPCGRGDGPHVCPLGPDGDCVKECICKPGFVRRSDGLCTHCTQCKQLDEDDCCDDEVYQECGTFCPETCASRGETESCTEQCVQGCFCKKGQVRDINGRCVDPKECPGKGGNKGGDKDCGGEKGCGGDPNAHPGCGINCGKTCATYKNPPKVCPLGCILHGCDCNDGYVKDPNVGKCVKPKDCTPTCKINEVYKKCGPACPATCNNGGDTTGCPEEPCVAGCFCKDGYVRANSGKCVKLGDCNKCVTNETYTDCGSLCPWDCSNYGDSIGCGAACIKGCFCTKGYFRNSNGDCVLLKDCPPKKCGENEYFSQCGPDCEPYCKDISDEIVCEGGCKYGCFCKEGYFRHNGNDKCVKIEDCNSACPKDEIFKTCGTSCQPTCDDPNPPCNKRCSRNCFCPDGFIREQKGGRCIKIDDCPPGCKGDPNARLSSCGDVCPATCANGGVRPPICILICKINSCICLPGFVLDDNGRCIKLDQCPPKGCGGDPNAHPGCGINCGRTCADYKHPPCDCDKRIGCIQHGCDCNDGYVKDDNTGKCVKPDDCTPICGINETFSQNPLTCPPQTCDAIGKAFACPANTTSPPACICKEGFLRNKENECVLKDDCDTCGDDPNARPGCGNPCGRTCADIGQPPRPCPDICTDGCDCIEGYWLDTDAHKCVLPKDCPPKGCGGDPNAHPGCGINCGRTCADYKHPPCDCDKRIGCIQHGCDCNDGYVFDKNINKCVKPKDCTPQCGPGQILDKCPVDCPSDFCPREDGPPVACSPPDPCNKPKCKCAFNFRKAKNGTCIPTRDCPPFKCDGQNEVFDACPPICPGETCADAKLNGVCPFNILIILECNPRCRCAEGFFRDENNVCIPASCCPDQ